MRTWLLVFIPLFVACSSSSTSEPAKAAPTAKETYWRRAFPTAAKFETRAIPPTLLAEADAGNTTYVEVTDANGQRLGYLRDFVGPVTTRASCPCDPIKVTLVFDAAGKFTTLIAPTPLTKYGHAPLTDEEQARLIAILRDPPAELLEVREPEDLVDATSGATKSQYSEFVVNRAALETRRLVQIVRDSESQIAGAPVADDEKTLEALIAKPESLERARALAKFLKTVTTDAVAGHAYVVMGRDYLGALKNGAAPDATIDDRIVDNDLADKIGPGLQAELCYRIAQEKAGASVADRCVQALSRYQEAAPIVALIQGTAAYFRGDYANAVAALDQASTSFNLQTEPALHARLASALVATGKTTDGCNKALSLHSAHPLMPDVTSLIDTCTAADKKFATKLAAADKDDKELLLGLKQDGAKIPVIDVDDARLTPVKLDAAEPGKVTVLVFFATWCPHCQAELPKVAAFANKVQNDAKLRDKVRVIGVRTSVERETESFESFQQRIKVPFAIYTDTAMSIGFSNVVEKTGLLPVFPTLIVADESGRVRYVMPNGMWRDTQRELEWTVQSLLK